MREVHHGGRFRIREVSVSAGAGDRCGGVSGLCRGTFYVFVAGEATSSRTTT